MAKGLKFSSCVVDNEETLYLEHRDHFALKFYWNSINFHIEKWGAWRKYCELGNSEWQWYFITESESRAQWKQFMINVLPLALRERMTLSDKFLGWHLGTVNTATVFEMITIHCLHWRICIEVGKDFIEMKSTWIHNPEMVRKIVSQTFFLDYRQLIPGTKNRFKQT